MGSKKKKKKRVVTRQDVSHLYRRCYTPISADADAHALLSRKTASFAQLITPAMRHQHADSTVTDLSPTPFSPLRSRAGSEVGLPRADRSMGDDHPPSPPRALSAARIPRISPAMKEICNYCHPLRDMSTFTVNVSGPVIALGLGRGSVCPCSPNLMISTALFPSVFFSPTDLKIPPVTGNATQRNATRPPNVHTRNAASLPG